MPVKKLSLMDILEEHLPTMMSNGQIRCECPFRENHTDGSGKMSMFISPDINAYHCFGGETRVPTDCGTFPIKDLVGKNVKVLTQTGSLVEATFSCYGKNRLWELHLSRDGVTKVLRTTQKHRWFVRGKKDEILTENLVKGDYLESSLFSAPLEKEQSLDGIRHGIVFGDGTLDKSRTKVKALVNLHGVKMELGRFFSDTENRGTKLREDNKEYIRIYNVSGGESFKKLPPIDAPLKYLRGFLAGYVSTDGCMSSKGTLILGSSRYEDLEFCREAFFRIGVSTSSIGVQHRKGFASTPSPFYKMTIRTNNLDETFFIRKDQRDRFLSYTKKYQRINWKVTDVHPTDSIENVYCADVPIYHTFTLEDDILTGNCFSCNAKGNLIGLLTKRFNVGYFSAIELVRFNEYEHKKEEFDLDIMWSINDLPKEFIKRGYDEDTLKHFGVGTSDDGSMVIPYYRNFDKKTELLGYQKRWYEPSRRVKNSTGFDKQNYLYNHNPKNLEVYVVEGQSDVWRLYQYGYKNAVALMGAELSDYQAKCLSFCTTIYLALDNDDAGRIATEKIYNKMKNHCNVMLVPYPSKDVGECSKDDWDDAVTRCTDYLTYTMEMSMYSDSYTEMRDSVLHKRKAVKEEKVNLEDIDYNKLIEG